MTGQPPGALLADQAHDAVAPGDCARCPHGVHRGERIARLVGGAWVHTWCLAPVTTATGRRQRIKARVSASSQVST